jgi:hypothetical protein
MMGSTAHRQSPLKLFKSHHNGRELTVCFLKKPDRTKPKLLSPFLHHHVPGVHPGPETRIFYFEKFQALKKSWEKSLNALGESIIAAREDGLEKDPSGSFD